MNNREIYLIVLLIFVLIGTFLHDPKTCPTCQLMGKHSPYR